VWSLDAARRALVSAVSTVAPDWRVSGARLPVHVHPSDNREALLRLYYDPLTLHDSRMAAVDGLVTLMHAAARAAPGVRCPVLAVYGGRDDLVPPEATRRLWAALPATARRDFIPGGHHLLLRDRNGDVVTRDMLSWLDTPTRPLPSGGDVAASAWRAGWTDTAPFALLPSRIDGLGR
ncbi:alpha/beta hydrolase, partial [Ameyamaea chiangmaiensis]